MNRIGARRVLALCLVVWLGSQLAVAGGSPMSAPTPSPGLLDTTGHGTADNVGHRPGTDLPGDTTDSSLSDASARSLVGWVKAVIHSGTPTLEPAYRIVPPPVLVGVTQRTNDEPTFEHDRREAVYRSIADSPGRYVAELEGRTGIPESSLRHHVRVLEEKGLISSALIRGKRRYFPPETDRSVIELEAALDDESTAPILGALARRGPANVSELASTIDSAPSTVSYHLQQLADSGLVVRERRGQSVVNRLEPAARTYLENSRRFDETNLDEEPTEPG